MQARRKLPIITYGVLLKYIEEHSPHERHVDDGNLRLGG